jgi:hypothetical protein
MPTPYTLLRLANQFIANNPALLPDINSALKEISDNPFVDAKTKFYYPVPPCVISLYKKDDLWVLYHLNDACTLIEVWNIGKQGDRVNFR